MAIRVTMQESQMMEELQAKLGEANIEIVFDEEEDKILEPKKDEEDEEQEEE